VFAPDGRQLIGATLDNHFLSTEACEEAGTEGAHVEAMEEFCLEEAERAELNKLVVDCSIGFGPRGASIALT